MKKSIRLLSALLACVMCIAALSGCADKNTGRTEDGKILLTVGQWPDPEAEPEEYARTEAMRLEFMEKYPDIEVVGDTWKFDLQTFVAMAEAGTLPTVYQAYFTEAQRIMDQGYAADITKGMKKQGTYEKVSEYLLDTIGKDGKIYFVPYSMYTMGLLINVNLFKEAGLVNADGSPKVPETFEQVREYAKIIKDKTGKAGLVLPTAENQGGWTFMCVAWNYGVDFIKEIDGKWTSNYATPEAEEAFQFLYDMKWVDGSLPANTKVNAAEAIKLIGTDQVAMTLAHPGMLNELMSGYGMDPATIGFARMPAGPKDDTTLMGGAFYAVAPNATEEQIDAALKWIDFEGTTPDMDEEGKTRYYNNKKQQAEDKTNVIGVYDITVWNEKATAQAYKEQVQAEFANVLPQNVASYNNKEGTKFQAEESVCAQDLYAEIDRCIQEVLTNKSVNIAELLKTSASDLQVNSLDYEN